MHHGDTNHNLDTGTDTQLW